MKRETVKYIVALLLVPLLMSGVRAEDSLIVKKNPKYNFYTTTVRNSSPTVFDTLDAAFAEVGAYYSSLNSENARYQVGSLRESPSAANYNDLPIAYMWDVYRTSDGKLNITSDWTIYRQGYCDQESFLEDDKEWVLYLDGNVLWCEKQVPIPIDVEPVTCAAQNYAPTDYSGLWAEQADGGMVGNPIVVPVGEKIRTEPDYIDAGSGALGVERYSRSRWATDNSTKNYGLSRSWRHNHNAGFTQLAPHALRIDLPGGRERLFVRDTFGNNGIPGAWRPANGLDVLTQSTDIWTLQVSGSNSLYIFRSEERRVG